MIRVRLQIEMPEDNVDFDYQPRIAHLRDLNGQVRGLLADAQRDAQAWLDAREPKPEPTRQAMA